MTYKKTVLRNLSFVTTCYIAPRIIFRIKFHFLQIFNICIHNMQKDYVKQFTISQTFDLLNHSPKATSALRKSKIQARPP